MLPDKAKKFKLTSNEVESFRLYTPPKPSRHTFISFKTDPDFSKAQWVMDQLKASGVDAVPLHGGDFCPIGEEEKEKARHWITNFLAGKINEAHTLIIISSAATLHSQWTWLEYSVAMMLNRNIYLLWFDGENPVNFFVPPPIAITKRLPSGPVYLVDFRSDRREEAMSRLSAVVLHHQESIAAFRKRQFLIVLAAVVALLVSSGKLIFSIRNDMTGDPVQDSIRLDQTKAQGNIILYFFVVVLTLFLPKAMRIARENYRSGLFQLVVPGYTEARLGAFICLNPFILFGGLIGSVIAVITGLPIFIFLQWLRRYLIFRHVRQFDEKGVPLGLNK